MAHPWVCHVVALEEGKKGETIVKQLGVITLIIGIILSVYWIKDEKATESIDPVNLASLRVIANIDGGSRMGTAFIFDETDDHYYVLTNEHVVRDALSVQLIDYHHQSHVATIVSGSPHVSYDLAILKFEKADELAVLSLASSSYIGQSVEAIGYPNTVLTVTSGVIIAIESIDHTITFPVIQHDAEIDHGSSGGALVNAHDQIVGINFAIYHDGEDYQISYAVPVERLKEYLLTIDYR